MQRYAIVAGLLIVGVLGPKAEAARCSGISPVVFCDDFDRWCSVPPADPQAACGCTTDTPDNSLWYAAWPALPKLCSGVSAAHNLQGSGSWKCGTNEGYMLRIWQYDSGSPKGIRLYRHERSMTPEILANPLNVNAYPGINGAGPIDRPLTTTNTIPSDYVDSMSRTLRPQSLKGQFFMNMTGGGAFSRMVSYVELHLDNDRAPFDWVMDYCQPGRTTPTGSPVGGDNNPRLIRTDGQVHASFAVGLVSTMDTNPCDFDTGFFPTTWRLAVYDGLNWNVFQAPRFDIPLTSPADLADLKPKDGWNFIYFAIGADYIEIRLRNSAASTDPKQMGTNQLYAGGYIPNTYTVARVPRQYKGPFNKISIGPNHGLDRTTPTCENFGTADTPNMLCNGGSRDRLACTTSDECPAATTNCSPRINGANNTLYIEELVLYDGIFAGPPSPCCLPDLTCQTLDPGSCAAAGGVFHGDQQSCTPSPCCPIPFADSDNDHDVDMADFAAIQRCMNTGPGSPATLGVGCGCFDKNKNGIIDETDLENFIKCGTGDAVPWVASPDCPQ